MNKDEAIKAGAAFRLAKSLLVRAENDITRSLHLTKEKWDKIDRARLNFASLETRIGFEERCYTVIGREISSLFYGDIDIPFRDEVDKMVLVEIKRMLEKMTKQVEDAINGKEI